MLVVWEKPKVRSARKAQQVLETRRDQIKASPAVAQLRERVSRRPGVVVLEEESRSLSPAQDGAMVIEIEESSLAREGMPLRAWCAERGLVLYDLSEGVLVVPQTEAHWPAGPSARLTALRAFARGVDATELGFQSRVARALMNPARPRSAEEARRHMMLTGSGALDISQLRPPTVPLPFRAPPSLDFMTAAAKAPRMLTPSAESRVLHQLRSRQVLARRRAAVTVASWPASRLIDAELARLAQADPDQLARGMSLLSLAVRGFEEADLIVSLAEEIVAEAKSEPDRRGDDPWRGQAATHAVLAAAVATGFAPTETRCARAHELIRALANLKSETERAEDLKRSLAEVCP